MKKAERERIVKCLVCDKDVKRGEAKKYRNRDQYKCQECQNRASEAFVIARSCECPCGHKFLSPPQIEVEDIKCSKCNKNVLEAWREKEAV